jgi:hypothetical protein
VDTLYIASPLKFESNHAYLTQIESIARECGFECWMPHKDAGLLSDEDLRDAGRVRVRSVLLKDLDAFRICSGAVFVLDGCPAGTLMEAGYACHLKRSLRREFLLVGIYSSLRGLHGLDPMVQFCFQEFGELVTSLAELRGALLKHKLPNS